MPEERPRLPRDVWRELKGTVRPADLDDVVKAVGEAARARDAGEGERALQLLEWAKSVAGRSASIREALGVLHYENARYAAAISELSTYRRLSGSQDHNHLLADSARALGRADRVADYVEKMAAAGVAADRVAEGYLVLAGARADSNDLPGAMHALQRAGLDQPDVQPWHPRLWYLAADLSERMGDADAAREYLGAILAVDEDYGDAAARLRRLDSRKAAD